ncbi:MAG TPA: hypothetical protein VKV04_01065, partial [Verrucomicrobiae bacterium]|nr:hypothetical protein [Verrucomicrobiae bacterium]
FSTNSWTYDGLNRPTTETTRDGATTSFGYDALGDLTSRSMAGGLSWNATYNSAGQILTQGDISGGQNTRNFTNTYNPSGPFAGLLNTTADNRGVTQTNSYDDYLRIIGVGTSGALAAQQMSCAWQYDVRGLLTNITQSFANTNTGPTTVISRQFDSYGQLLSESVSPGATISQSWDGAGRRVQSGNQAFQYQADGRIVGVSGSTFGYGDDGLLTGRTNSSRTVVINSRDGEGKLLQETTTANSSTILTENWNWTGDDMPASYTAARTDYTDSRQFTYGAATRRLTQETFNLNGSQSVTNNFTYDHGTAAGLGVLTAAGEGSNSWSSGLDAFSRISSETNSIIHRTANGNVNGAATLRGYLNGQPLNVTYDPHAASVWYSDIALSAGSSNTLSIYADHPSGLFTTNQNNSFTVASGAFDSEQSQYDGAGNVTNRVWKRSDGTVVRTQSLTWDAFGNLVNVTDLDGTNNGYNIMSVFDGLGRQVQTIETTISNNVALVTNPAPVIVTYAYDPQVEFLIEYVGITQGESSRQDWFAYGPDMSGHYGGMHGIGGLDSISSTAGTLNTIAVAINDAFGNVIGAITNSVLTWNPSRESLYAPVEGYAPPRLSLDAPAFASLAWRTRPVNAVGFVQLGLRPYDPVRRAFMAADPLGHDADAGLNTAFGGNPAAFFDPDGCDWKQAYAQVSQQNNWQTFNGEEILAQPFAMSTPYPSQYGSSIGVWVRNDDGTASCLHMSPGAFLSGGFAPDTSFGTWAANTFWNSDNIKAAWSEFSNPDLSSGWGVATWVDSGVSLVANSADAVANTIPVVGTVKSAVEDVGKAGIKSVIGAFSKDTAEVEAKQVEQAIAADVKGVRPYQVGTYGDLRSSSLSYDDLALDHQPSNASNVARMEQELGRPLTPDELAQVRDQGTAVAVPQDWHQSQSLTYGGRNTAAQIAGDAADPLAAATRDSQAMVNGASAENRAAAEAAAAEVQRRAAGL